LTPGGRQVGQAGVVDVAGLQLAKAEHDPVQLALAFEHRESLPWETALE
jgi:hypothetical protein